MHILNFKQEKNMSKSKNGRQIFNKRASSIQPSQFPQITNQNIIEINPSHLLQSTNLRIGLQNPQIQTIASQSKNQDIIFYEYEIVDKKAEDKYIKETIRGKGLCLCKRWHCILVGNLTIITFVCAILGLLVYMNTSITSTSKPLSYWDTCTIGSSNCDKLADLKCPNGTCLCSSTKNWNGTDCVCPTNQYYDGYDW